ncbi:hypothetical protein NFI96_001019 [Prochilodus magdalenae]|nr:hypothetical protein NFI96_001019 [Prochilodus magdalenae]
MQDNARPHVDGVCQHFLQDEGLEAMDWPTRSPDLNPIEHIWDMMSRSIHQPQTIHSTIAPQTVQELADALVQVCESPALEALNPHRSCMIWMSEADNRIGTKLVVEERKEVKIETPAPESSKTGSEKDSHKTSHCITLYGTTSPNSNYGSPASYTRS